MWNNSRYRINSVSNLSNSFIIKFLYHWISIKCSWLISRDRQNVCGNFSSIKLCRMPEILASFAAIIFFHCVYCNMKKHLQKWFFDKKDEEIIRLLFLSLEEACLFSVNIFNIIYIECVFNCWNLEFFFDNCVIWVSFFDNWCISLLS